MTTAPGGVAVIATQVARTDRRALSEAWYSALHLARNATPSPQPAKRGVTSRRTPSAPPAHPPSPPAARRPPAAPLPQRAERGASAPTTVTGERRQAPTESARRIERALATLSERRPAPAAQTVDVAGGRVRLLVRSDGGTTRIVALCSDRQREHIERALASARFRLAGAGLAVAAP